MSGGRWPHRLGSFGGLPYSWRRRGGWLPVERILFAGRLKVDITDSKSDLEKSDHIGLFRAGRDPRSRRGGARPEHNPLSSISTPIRQMAPLPDCFPEASSHTLCTFLLGPFQMWCRAERQRERWGVGRERDRQISHCEFQASLVHMVEKRSLRLTVRAGAEGLSGMRGWELK